ncbi:hypothetical protein ACWG8W_06340 [Citricoccus zhacaiensis]
MSRPNIELLLNAGLASAVSYAISLKLAMELRDAMGEADHSNDAAPIAFGFHSADLTDELGLSTEAVSLGLWELDMDTDGPWSIAVASNGLLLAVFNKAFAQTHPDTCDNETLAEALSLAVECVHDDSTSYGQMPSWGHEAVPGLPPF